MGADVADRSRRRPTAPDRCATSACFWPVCLERLGQPVLRVLDLHDADRARARPSATICPRLPHHRIAGVVVGQDEERARLSRPARASFLRVGQRRGQRLVADHMDAALAGTPSRPAQCMWFGVTIATASMPSFRRASRARHVGEVAVAARRGSRPSAAPEARAFSGVELKSARPPARTGRRAARRCGARAPMKAPSPPPTMPSRMRRAPGSSVRSLDGHVAISLRLFAQLSQAQHPPVRRLVGAAAGEVVEGLLGDPDDVVARRSRRPRARRPRDASGSIPIPAPPSRRSRTGVSLEKMRAEIHLPVAERAEAPGAVHPGLDSRHRRPAARSG